MYFIGRPKIKIMIARCRYFSSWRWISVLVLLILVTQVVVAVADAWTNDEEEAYQAWAKDAWLPAPFAVRTENPPSPAVLENYKETYGTWQLDDHVSNDFDRESFCGEFEHCDVPQDLFPQNSWQKDSDYVNLFLNEAEKLVDRARNAILAEYGKSPEDTEMFDLTYEEEDHRKLKGPPVNVGWTSKKSMKGLSRRLLHAIMTRDTFTFILGGHSGAAGHGNHFKQSYTMQFHKVMEPVFSYLGVRLISRNLAQGGLGTIQSALGSADIYGDEIDFIIWDSGMTEGRDGKAVDMFGRQALLGNRVPVLWNLNKNLLDIYHKHCDADVGLLGTGELGIPVTLDENHAKTLPYASQYYTCDSEHGNMCREHKYRANCWVERDDVIPPTKQDDMPGSQVSWHPGFRWHQLVGRILAYTVLTGLKDAIAIWKEAEGHVLPDEEWHVASYYDNIRNKVKNLNPDLGDCVKGYDGIIPTRMCKTQLRGRTEFTPRANPEVTSIRSVLNKDGYIPTVEEEILYNGPDVRNPMFDIPEGQVDVLAILNNGRKVPGDDTVQRQLTAQNKTIMQRRLDGNEIVSGKGHQLEHPAGYCDGTYNAICKRTASNPCLLNGHHDGRGGLRFNEYSGWIVMTIPKVKEGLIMIKMECWHFPEEVPLTEGWKTVNNERSLLRQRELKRQPPEYCENFHFEFAVDGKVTTYNLKQFMEAKTEIQRVVEVVTLLDDPSFFEKDNVEVAIRMFGCGNTKVFSLTHIYWA